MHGIIQATRKSASAVRAMQRWAFRVEVTRRDIDALRDRIGRDGCRSSVAIETARRGIAAQEARLAEYQRNLRAAETRYSNARAALAPSYASLPPTVRYS